MNEPFFDGSTNVASPEILLGLGEYPHPPSNPSNPVLGRLVESLTLEDDTGAVPFRAEQTDWDALRIYGLRVRPVAVPTGWVTLCMPSSPEWRIREGRLNQGLSKDSTRLRLCFSILPGKSRPGVLVVDAAPTWFVVYFSEPVAVAVPFNEVVQAYGAGGRRIACDPVPGDAGTPVFSMGLTCAGRVETLEFTRELRSVPDDVPMRGTPGLLDFSSWPAAQWDDVTVRYENPARTW